MAKSHNIAPYASTFERYVRQGVALMVQRVQQTSGLLPDELRIQALHTLSFAFQLPEIWPLTRDLLLLMAPKMEQAGHREDWMPYLVEGLRQSITAGDCLTHAECHLQVALLNRMVSKFELANQHLTASLEGFQLLGDTNGLARVLNELAWVAYLQNDYSPATHFVERALDLLEDHVPDCGMSYRVQGMIAIELGNYQSAESYHRQALLIFEAHNDQRRVAWSLQNLANALREQARYTEAILYYKRALEIISKIQDVHSSAVMQFNLGITYHRCGNDDEAIEYFQRSITMFTALNNKLYLAKVKGDLGLSYFCKHKYLNAEYAFKTSIQLFQELKEVNWRLNAIDGLAMCYLAQQRYNEAIVILEGALAELPTIVQAPNYNYLTHSLTKHLLEAKQQQSIGALVKGPV